MKKYSSFKGRSCSKVEILIIKTDIVINVTKKEHVVENKCDLPEPMGITVVRLDVEQGNESRYRLRLKDGQEARISVSKEPHFQKMKRHLSQSIYLLHKGWIAIIVQKELDYEVQIAFANAPGRFYVEAPGGVWYSAYISEDASYTYSSSDTKTGDIEENRFSHITETQILSKYAEQVGLTHDEVLELAERSHL